MSRRSRILLIRTLLPLAPMLGCSEVTAPVPDEVGTFSATVAGDDSRAFSGRALFTTDAPGPEYGFAIALVDPMGGGEEPAVRHGVYLYRDVGGAPTPGEHAVGPQSAFRGGVVLDGDGNDPLFCVAGSGTVRIITATSSAIRGSFDLQALCHHVGEGLPLDTIRASGSFRAVSGPITVPDSVAELPGLDGRFELRTAGGNPVPTAVFDGLVLIGDDEFVHLEITVTDGTIEIDDSGAYEHRVSQEVRVDDQPAPALDWVDRGTCVVSGAELNCVSNLVTNRAFTAVLGDGALEVTQDLNGEGLAVTYRYVRGG